MAVLHFCLTQLVTILAHTVFHDPEEKITYQIGNRSELSKNIGLPVICDFRIQDVQLGGQGAPLVPIGDLLLFKDYSHCLNLGGFSNISVKYENKIIALFISKNILILLLNEIKKNIFIQQ